MPSSLVTARAVVFDLDGVLMDTEPVHLEVARRLVAPAELPVEEYERFVGGGHVSFSGWISEKYGMALTEVRNRYDPALR